MQDYIISCCSTADLTKQQLEKLNVNYYVRTSDGKQLGASADGRFSGGTRGICVGHICPEAADGGIIGLIENGDKIIINLPERSISLEVSDDVINERRKKFVMPEPKERKGVLAKYARSVKSASLGAIS